MNSDFSSQDPGVESSVVESPFTGGDARVEAFSDLSVIASVPQMA